MTIPTILVTGASSGLGQAIASRLASNGERVIGTSRNAALPLTIAPRGLTMARLDVCDDESVTALVQHLVDRDAVPNCIILNAGYGISGAVEDTPAASALAQFDTNVVGAHRVVRALLPALRAAGGGQLIFIGSVAGRIALPFQAFYCASKAALASYVEALRVELRPFGIAATLIEPGDHCTEFPQRRELQGSDSPYEPIRSRVLRAMVASEKAGASPETLAALVAGIVASVSPRPRYLKISAVERWFVVQRALLPGAWFESVLRSVYRIP